jgi:menaquinone-dependent protoporphyrinogen oxidase
VVDMTTVLVTYASKHGSTEGIAERIAQTLVRRGYEAESGPIEAVRDVARYDAIVLGSAVYMGSWMKGATAFARREFEVLSDRPVWLFSSGPLGDRDPDADDEPKDVIELAQAIGPRDHRVFFGALVHDRMGLAERLVMKAVHAPEGDFRDWEAIEAWAESIADALDEEDRGRVAAG